MATEAQNQNTPPVATENKVSPDQLLELVDSQGEIIAEQQNEITTLKAKIEALENAQPKPTRGSGAVAAPGTFKVGGKEYRVLRGLMIRRKPGGPLEKLSAKDIIADKDLRESLVKKRSGIIQAV